MQTLKRLLLPVCAAFFAGCASNPYKLTYTASVSDKVPKGEPAALRPADGEARLLSSQDLRADGIKLLQGGYRPVGRSKFRGQYVDASLALEQAREIGVGVVLVMQKHVGNETVSVAVQDWVPDRRIRVQESAQTQNSDSNVVQTQTHESVTTIEGEYVTRYEPQTVETFDHSASYWKKAPPPILGIFASDLDDAERKAQQSNKGVLVKVLVQNSPAFRADILRGDIVRRLGTHEVLGTDDFFEQVSAQAGKKVELQLWRDGKILTKTVELAKP
jgi:hypothetical protein